MSKSNKGLYRNHPSVNTIEWRWKRYDVRADGKVFWQYGRYGEYWVTWETALKTGRAIADSAGRARKSNPEKHNKANAEWRKKNKEKHRENARIWGKLNRERCAANKRKRDNHRRKNDPIYAMRARLRSRIRTALKDGGLKKKTETYDILGADYKTVTSHLESMFCDGMSWENRSEWHIDHIIPLSSANDEESLIRLCHYTNLQPLWAMDNLKKGNRH